MPFPKVLNFLPTEILRLAIIKTLLSYCFILQDDFMETLFVVLTLNIYFTLRRFNTSLFIQAKKIKMKQRRRCFSKTVTVKNQSSTKFMVTQQS